MRTKSPKQELNVVANPQYEQKQKIQQKKQQKIEKPQSIISEQKTQKSSELPYPSPPPKKREQLKKVQDDIEVMRNKILLLKIQLQKEQQGIKMNKSRTEQVIRKKINVNKIQKYKIKDTSGDIERAESLRMRNASLRQSRQSEMQNIFKAIYLVKLDDARQIKNLSKSHRQKILQMNEATSAQQLQRKKKAAGQQQRAKQKYERYWKEKITSIYEGENKAKQEIQRVMNEKKDQLKQLRDQEIKLLENMNKIQVKQMQTKKQYLAALSLPVKDVAQALDRSKSSLDQTHSKDKSQFKLNRMSSEISKSKNGQNSKLTHNFSSLSGLDNSFNDHSQDKFKHFKVPNSTVNKEKLKVILKELKRLDKKNKQSSFAS